MKSSILRLVAAAALSLPLASSPVLAAGEGSGGGSSDSSANNCRKGLVWDKRQKKCVSQDQSNLDDESIYEAGRDLAKAGRYDEAITVLSMARDKSDWRILNYLGYSHRMQGRITVGLGYYYEALLSKPDSTLVREYLGEAYLQLGDLAAAKEQLGEIEKRCGTSCEEYTALAKRIDTFVKG